VLISCKWLPRRTPTRNIRRHIEVCEITISSPILGCRRMLNIKLEISSGNISKTVWDIISYFFTHLLSIKRTSYFSNIKKFEDSKKSCQKHLKCCFFLRNFTPVGGRNTKMYWVEEVWSKWIQWVSWTFFYLLVENNLFQTFNVELTKIMFSKRSVTPPLFFAVWQFFPPMWRLKKSCSEVI